MSEIDDTLKQLKEKKQLADNNFGQKEYDAAIENYLEIIKDLKLCFESRNLSEEEATRFIEVIGIPTHLNISRAFFKKSNFNEVVKYSSKIIELDARNLKALYIRCRSYITIQDIELAEEDLKKIRSLDGAGSEIKELTEMLEIKRKEKEAREKAVYKKMIHSGSISDEQEDRNPKSFKETIVLLFFEIWSLISMRLVDPISKIINFYITITTSFLNYIKDLFVNLLNFSYTTLKYVIIMPWKSLIDIYYWLFSLFVKSEDKPIKKQ